MPNRTRQIHLGSEKVEKGDPSVLGILPGRVAIYLRVSTQEQSQGWGLDGQYAECHAYCLKRGYRVVRKYSDVESGRVAEREKWQLMLQHAAERRFDTVVVWRRDRFGRDPVHNAIAERELKKAGVRVESIATGPQEDTDENALLNNVVDAISLYEARKIAARCHMGRKAGARAGAWTSGKPPMGYKRNRDTKRLVPDEPAASEVRRFFRDLADGSATLNQIALALRRPPSSLMRWVDNRVYLGELRYDGVVTPGAHPALVDEATWDKARRNLAFRARFYGRVSRFGEHPATVADVDQHHAHGQGGEAREAVQERQGATVGREDERGRAATQGGDGEAANGGLEGGDTVHASRPVDDEDRDRLAGRKG